MKLLKVNKNIINREKDHSQYKNKSHRQYKNKSTI